MRLRDPVETVFPCRSSEWSQTMGTPWPPSESISAAVSSTMPRPGACASTRYVHGGTAAPSSNAIPLPIPRLAPVTRATIGSCGVGMMFLDLGLGPGWVDRLDPSVEYSTLGGGIVEEA